MTVIKLQYYCGTSRHLLIIRDKLKLIWLLGTNLTNRTIAYVNIRLDLAINRYIIFSNPFS